MDSSVLLFPTLSFRSSSFPLTSAGVIGELYHRQAVYGALRMESKASRMLRRHSTSQASVSMS